MTDQLTIDSLTHDRFCLVPPYNARIKGGKGSSGASVSTEGTLTRKRPSWLHDGPLTERVRVISCATCHRAVLEALCDGVIPTRADLVRLTPAAELALILTGGHTVRLGPPAIRDHTGQIIGAVPQCMWSRHLEQQRADPGGGIPVHDCARHHGPADRTLLARTPRPAQPADAPPPF